jgi:hypothetical protein
MVALPTGRNPRLLASSGIFKPARVFPQPAKEAWEIVFQKKVSAENLDIAVFKRAAASPFNSTGMETPS